MSHVLGVNLSESLSGSPSELSELVKTINTSDIGSEFSITVMDVSPPASVVTRPLLPLIVRPARSSSLLVKDIEVSLSTL